MSDYKFDRTASRMMTFKEADTAIIPAGNLITIGHNFQ
jgi:hypothetical protein